MSALTKKGDLDRPIKQEPMDTEENTVLIEPYEIPIEIKTEQKDSSMNTVRTEVEVKIERYDHEYGDTDIDNGTSDENKSTDSDVRNNLMQTLSMVKNKQKNVANKEKNTPTSNKKDCNIQKKPAKINESTVIRTEQPETLQTSTFKSEPSSSRVTIESVLETKTREVKKYDGTKEFFVATFLPNNRAVVKYVQSSGESIDVFTCRILTDEEIAQFRQKERDNIMFKASQYKCETCIEKFCNLERWDKHLSDFHKPERPFECSICAQRYHSESALEFHTRLHYRFFNCLFCKFSRQRYDLMENHYNRLHKKSEVVCPDCKEVLPTHVEFKKHRFNNHKTQFSCSLCPAIFFRQTAYKEHMESNHSDTPPQFKCLVCQQRFHNSRRLLNHVRGRHQEKVKDPHYCEICNKYYSTPTIYKTHIKKKHATDEYKFECDYCGKRFYSRIQITQHIDLEHCSDYKYKCDLCDKKCKTDAQLRSHIRNRHTGRKPQKRRNCDLCGKSFANRATLEQHMNSHLGLRPFLCPFCDADFSFSGALHTHVRLKHKCKLPPVKEREKMIAERERRKKEMIEITIEVKKEVGSDSE